MRTTLHQYSRSFFWGLLFLLLGLRALLLYQYVLVDPFAEVLLLDAQGYDTWAKTITQGDWLGKETFHQAPLYPYFLALLYTVFGESLFIVYLVQGIMSASLAFLFYGIGRDYFDLQTGKITALLSLGFGFYAFYSLKILPVTFVLFLTLLLLWQLRQSVQTLAPWQWFFSGILSGLTVLASPALLLFTGAIVLWTILILRSWATSLSLGGCFLLGFGLMLAPVTGRNLWLEGDFVLVAANDGETFYQGTNAQAQGTYTPIAALSTTIAEQKTRSKQMAEEALGRSLSRRAVSQYWWHQGLRYIQEHPLAYVLLLGKKLYLVLSGKDVSLIYFARFEQDRFLPLLRYFFVNQYLLFPLCILGLLFYARQEHFLLLAFLGVQLVILLLFYVSTRYRLLLTPVIVLFAGKALSSLPALFHLSRARKVFAVTTLLALVSFVVDQRSPYAQADQHHNLGIVYHHLGVHTQALTEFQEALKYRPASPEILNNLGGAYYALGHYQQAIAAWELAKRLNPSLVLLDYNLAMAYQEIDQEKAVHHLRVYLESAQHIATEQVYIAEAQKRLQEWQEGKQ